MNLTIKHISKYKFSKNLSYGVQRLRLKPQNNKIQNINTVSYTHLTLPTNREV